MESFTPVGKGLRGLNLTPLQSVGILELFKTGVLGCWACVWVHRVSNRKELEETGRKVLSSPVCLTFRRQ